MMRSEEQIKHILTDIAEKEVPDVNLYPNIQKQLNRGKTTRALPALRYARAAASLLVLIFAGAVGYAVYQTSSHASPGVSEDLKTEFNMEQEDQGWTASLDWAYADANRISVAYSQAMEPDAPPSAFLTVTLTTADGQVIPQAFGGGGGGGGTSDGVSINTSVNNYNPADLNITGDTIDLILAIRYTDENPNAGGQGGGMSAPPAGSASGGGGGGGGQPDTQAMPTPEEPVQTVEREFVFEFSVPFYGKTTGTPDQSEQANDDLTVTFDSLTTTPSMTIVRLCLSDALPENMVAPVAVVDTGLQSDAYQGRTLSAEDHENNCYTFETFLEAPLTPEQMTVTLTEFQSNPMITAERGQAMQDYLNDLGYDVEIEVDENGFGFGMNSGVNSQQVSEDDLRAAERALYDFVDVDDITFTVTFD